ncbi:MAG: undecaprenyl-diphosphate phosphatase [Candidatus Puniceispirillum sp.]|nr:undecaprenyl-diphosphate phosphatase [Candidatus Puniceispirillum sp.]
MPLSLILFIAAVQGVTEFLPVSSSGHLVLVPVITDQPYQGQSIDVAAHVGTLIAVLVYLRRDVISIITAMLGFGDSTQMASNRRLGLMIAAATLPVVIVGFMVNYAAWHWLTLVTTLAWANLIFAGLLWAADRFGRDVFKLTDMRWSAALAISLMQVCALIPGASRSGVTMTAARFFGYERLAAARFSLLLSLPAIAGAGLLKTIDLIELGDMQLGLDAALVALLSALFAWLAIRLMMSWLARASFAIFVVYRLALGSVLLLALQQGWIAAAI